MTFSELSQYFEKLEKTASRNTMTEILAELFRRADACEIGKICYLLQGRVVPLYEALEFGMAEKLMFRAIASAYGLEETAVLREFKHLGDLGSAAEALYRGQTSQKLTIAEVYRRLYDLTQLGGKGSQDKKIQLLAGIFSDVDALAARYLVRILLDKLRLGFSDMTILDGLSFLLAGDKSLRVKLEETYNRRPDIGFLAQAVKEQGMKGLSSVRVKVGVPILAALCQRLPTAEEMIKKMGKVAVEPKYDGVRVAIHYQEPRTKNQKPTIKTFSRNLENTTDMFPELQDVGKQLNAREAILDSEAVGMDPQTGKLIRFQETMTRKRKYEIEKARATVPLRFFVFDILYKDGNDLLNIPLRERRKALEITVKKNKTLVISPQIVTDQVRALKQYHDEQLRQGLEGAVVKKWDSPYEPGRRGYSWVKFKEEEGKTGKLLDTFDAVIMGYYRGQGKRTGFGIGAFLAGVRQGNGFVTLTKVGTGVSDELWRELRQKLQRLQVKQQPKEYFKVNKIFVPDVWVEPGLVVEVAGDDLTKSPTHGGGVAVRFPRLVRIRTDKSPREATTTEEVEKMFKLQGRKA